MSCNYYGDKKCHSARSSILFLVQPGMGLYPSAMRKTLTVLIAFLSCSQLVHAQVGVNTRLCSVKSNGQVFSRTVCRALEVDITPKTTTTNTQTGLIPTKCRAVSVQESAVSGVANPALQCDSATEFVLTWGFSSQSSNSLSTPALRKADLMFTSAKNVPVGIEIETYVANGAFFSTTLEAVCCKK